MSDPVLNHALWYAAEGRCELRPAALGTLRPGQALVRATHSCVSRGTERLILMGKVPPSEYERMRGPGMEGAFPFPVKYGYQAAGVVEAGPPGLLGKRVFALHPHQTRFPIEAAGLTVIPDGIPSRRAALAANMETALNAVWDSGAGPGDRIVVVGAGVVGLLIAFLSASLPGAEVTVVDVAAERAALAKNFGCGFALPDQAPGDADIVFHASSTGAGLQTALDCAGFEAAVVEVSWHGAGQVSLSLGGAFHSRRLRLISSQVGQVSPSRRARWSYSRRIQAALGMLRDDRLDALITHEIAFADAPGALPKLLTEAKDALGILLVYPQN